MGDIVCALMFHMQIKLKYQKVSFLLSLFASLCVRQTTIILLKLNAKVK